MSWKTILPCADSSVLSCLPQFKVTTAFGCLSRNRLQEMKTDLLVLTCMYRRRPPAAFTGVDKALAGGVTAQIKSQSFSGRLGERLVISNLPAGAAQKAVLIVGLGDYQAFGRTNACALFRLVIDTAVELGAESVLIPIAPNRLSEQSIGLRATAAVLRCRLEERALKGTLGNLKTVEIVCTPQAKAHIEEGLKIAGPRCAGCDDPQLKLPTTTRK